MHGSADTCKEKLLAIAEQFSADELMVLTITGDYATRLDSYERLATAFNKLQVTGLVQVLHQLRETALARDIQRDAYRRDRAGVDRRPR